MFQALSDNDVVMNLHIGQGFGALSLAEDAPIDNLMVLAPSISMIAIQDLLWDPHCANSRS